MHCAVLSSFALHTEEQNTVLHCIVLPLYCKWLCVGCLVLCSVYVSGAHEALGATSGYSFQFRVKENNSSAIYVAHDSM